MAEHAQFSTLDVEPRVDCVFYAFLCLPPHPFAGVSAVKRTALPFLHPFSLRSWAAPDSLILFLTALCAAAFPLVPQPKVGRGEGNAGRPPSLAVTAITAILRIE